MAAAPLEAGDRVRRGDMLGIVVMTYGPTAQVRWEPSGFLAWESLKSLARA